MNLLKKLPIFTIFVVGFVILKFYPQIMGKLDKSAPSVANALRGTQTATQNP
ncbi:hypothetical protein [Flavobacterium soli]|uniref:hypothetical protein n=1 Tax=Flavobacterium soli TaxID=344881 RepID=UPI0004264100|nr:hypothetical protein [Flavobacterium soli]